MPNINWVSNTDNDEAILNFFKRASEGGYRLVSKYLRDTNQRGGGGRGCVPVNILSAVQTGSGNRCKNEDLIKNVSPIQQVTDIASSEVKREKEELPPESFIKRKTVRKRAYSKRKSGSAHSTPRKRVKNKDKDQLTELEKLFKKGS